MCGVAWGATLLLTYFVGADVRNRSSGPSLRQGSTEFACEIFVFFVRVRVETSRLLCKLLRMLTNVSRAPPTIMDVGVCPLFVGLDVGCWLSWAALVSAVQVDSSNQDCCWRTLRRICLQPVTQLTKTP